MKLRLAIPLALAVTAGVLPAHAALITRSMLISACTSHDQKRMNDCAGYITGVADMADGKDQGVCIPQGANLGLLRKGVTDWLQAHTTNNGPAAPSVLSALRALYRCGG